MCAHTLRRDKVPADRWRQRGRERDRVPEMGRIWDKRKMKEKKRGRGAEKRRRMAQPGSAKCARRAYARKEEGKSEEREITREEVYRDLWRVSIGYGIPKGRRTTIRTLR